MGERRLGTGDGRQDMRHMRKAMGESGKEMGERRWDTGDRVF